MMLMDYLVLAGGIAFFTAVVSYAVMDLIISLAFTRPAIAKQPSRSTV
jgi:hypothetical protein